MSSETNAKLYEKLLPNNYQKKLTQKNIFMRVYILLKTSCYCTLLVIKKITVQTVL